MFGLFDGLKKNRIGNCDFYLRKKSIDFEVYDYVFKEKYHRPYRPLSNSRPVILDLGANIGLTIIDFKIEYPTSQVYGFEMDKDNFDLALKNTKQLQNVQLVNKAVWYENTIFSYKKDGNFDAYKLSAEFNDIEQTSVYTISLDQIVEENGLTQIDYVKMDIEGAEYEVFQNSLSWLKITNEVKIEVHYGEDIFNFIQAKLVAHGFRTVKDTHHWSTLIGYRE